MNIIKAKPQTEPTLRVVKEQQQLDEIMVLANQLIAELKPRDGVDGVNGQSVEIRRTDSSLEWRYTNEKTSTPLIAINELRGADGQAGKDGRDGLDGKVGQAGKDGRNGKDGKNGIDGQDGREILLRTNSLYIQWKYENESKWRNLIKLEDLRGPRGYAGQSWGGGGGATQGKALAETGTSLPASGTEGEMFFNTSSGVLYIYTGGTWTAISGGGTVGGTFEFMSGDFMQLINGDYMDFIT